MLEEVTWKEFAGWMLVITSVWYVVIATLYYRKEIMDWIKSKRKGSKEVKTLDYESEEEDEEELMDYSEDNAFAELESVVNDLRMEVMEKAGSDADKEQLLIQMQLLLAGYDGLKKSAFRVAINNFIISQAKELCGVIYSEEELEEAWEAL